MHPGLEEKVERLIQAFGKMPAEKQLEKLDQILMVYARGNPLAVEGYKLAYISLVSVQAKLREVDTIQSTLDLYHKNKIKDQFQKIHDDIDELTRLIFPDDEAMACELVKAEYSCAPQ